MGRMIDHAPDDLDPRWELRPGPGPVIATAVHAGHAMREELATRSGLGDEARRREEDPLTDVLAASVADTLFVSRVSRFEVDLNRPENEAVYREPADAWGLDLWHEPPTDAMVERSLAARAVFYREMARRIEALVAEHGRVLLLDVHSFNHRRDGPGAAPAPAEGNPDIDLGVTTADPDRFAETIGAFREALASVPVAGRAPDVRENVRFPDGGHWPEWVHAEYGDAVCTITLEYKKIFMDEWAGTADLAALEALRTGLVRATAAARLAGGFGDGRA